ncbi:hypothetical protein PHYPSEUDO_002295 [Phytophthora pseudosyringae]|uniref:Uncharacterized protein n=1 Tax=Phytophthora pseudosyringae TaxID=221518 RepID=A0A8T1WFV5_9STRA|nr:hypothetical protein PHYPSEUDO_002295 [Phytophthora pseudosyringae]
MRQETMAPLGAGRRTMMTAAAVATTWQTAWTQVNAVETPLGSAEGDAKGDVGEEEPIAAMGDDVIGGELSSAVTPTSPHTPDAREDPNAEALVLVTEPPTAAPAIAQVAANEEEVASLTRNSVGELELNLDNATGNGEEDSPAPTHRAGTTETLTTEAPTTEALIEPLPQTTQAVAIVEVTTKPSLRTQDPAVISDAATNDAAETHAPGYLSQGSNPLALLALAGICCVFLLAWGRKRRSSGISTSGTPGGATKGPKVQYTQVPDEQPFSHSQDDDDEYCDDYEEDTFANDRDNWDDWEGNSTQAQVSQLNPFVAAPSAPRPMTPRQGNSSPRPLKLAQPLAAPPLQQQQQHAQPQEIAIASKGDLLPSSVESNSSSDSFEVVTDEAHAPPTSNRGATADTENESEGVDDLFSQFGMVPTFKKSAVVPPPPAATSTAPVSQPATASSVSTLPTAAEASALFAAEMDDELTAEDAADEWGEDDEWVKGI